MRTLLYLFILTSLVGQSYGQVKFITVDSLEFIKAGQAVKLDFKTRNGHWKYPPGRPSLRGTRYIRDIGYLSDTVYLQINKSKTELIEHKGQGTDWYMFDFERLESRNFKPGHVLVIPESKILKIQGDSILFRLTINLLRDDKKQKQVKSWTEDNWIPKQMLYGVLISSLE